MVTNKYDSLGRVASQLDMNRNAVARIESSKVTVSGTVTTGNVVTIKVRVQSLAGGLKSVSCTVQAGDTLTSIATGLRNAVNNESTLAASVVAATSSGAVITLTSLNPATYELATSSGATVTLSATATTGDVLTVTVFNSGLAGRQKSVSYTVQANDTTTTIAQQLLNAVNADSALAAIGVTASQTAPAGARFRINSTSSNTTTYSTSKSANATESVVLDYHSQFFIAGWRSEFVNAFGQSKTLFFDESVARTT